MFFVQLFVSGNFIQPPFCFGFWYYKIFTTFMPMPKTTMNKYDGSILWQHNIWFAGQVFTVQPVSKTLCK